MLVGFMVLPERLVHAAHAVDRYILDKILDDEVNLFSGAGVLKIGVHVFHSSSPLSDRPRMLQVYTTEYRQLAPKS